MYNVPKAKSPEYILDIEKHYIHQHLKMCRHFMDKTLQVHRKTVTVYIMFRLQIILTRVVWVGYPKLKLLVSLRSTVHMITSSADVFELKI